MDRACTPWPRWPRLRRWLAAGLCAGVPLTGLGCRAGGYGVDTREVPAYRWAETPRASAEGGEVRQVGHVEPAVQPVPPKELAITLDAVLRLAEQHNARLGLARERLHESQLNYCEGSKGWIPNVYAGIAYYRHEGGIQQFDGTLTRSSTGAVYPAFQIQSELDLREGVFRELDLQRRVWQSKAELSQVTNEVLVDAATTYVDLLTARRSEALARELEKFEKKLLERAEKLAKSERGAEALVQTLRASLRARQQLLTRLRQQGNAASAKLVYLLGLPPCSCLVPVDPVLAPIELVDASPPCCDLVGQALAGGPGVRELEELVALSQRALEATTGPSTYLPSIQVNLCEGPFGAGPGMTLAWDNRLDIGVQVRWNLSDVCRAEDKRNIIRSRQAQAVYTYEDLKGKLAAGVSEAREAILAGREQIGEAAGQIQNASESYRLSDRRMEEGLAQPSEVLLAIRNLEQAHFNHVQAIQNHNKAQVRLLMLLGCAAPPPRSPAPPGPGELPLPRLEQKKEDGEKDPKKEKGTTNEPPRGRPVLLTIEE